MTNAPIWSSSDYPYACLKDVERTLAFRRAIQQTVRPGDTVVDIGAGSGILSFFAAEAGAARVYAVEIDPGLGNALRASIALNGLDDRIVVVEGDATEAELPSSPDVIISELIDTGLIEEMQISVGNSLHARAIIGPRTRLIPHAYETYVELVEFDDQLYGFRFSIPFHEWPNYSVPDTGWYATSVRPLTERAMVSEVDLTQPVKPFVRQRVDFSGIGGGVANGVRLSAVAHLTRDISIGQANAVNGNKVLRLEAPIPVETGAAISVQIGYTMSGGLTSFFLEP